MTCHAHVPVFLTCSRHWRYFLQGMPRPRSHLSDPTSQVVGIGVLLTSPHVEVTFGVFVEFSYACLVLKS